MTEDMVSHSPLTLAIAQLLLPLAWAYLLAIVGLVALAIFGRTSKEDSSGKFPEHDRENRNLSHSSRPF